MAEPTGYISKPYSCRQYIATDVSHLGFERNDSGAVSKVVPLKTRSGRLGICMALSARWIQMGIQLGRAPAARELATTIHQTAIAQSAYERSILTADPAYPDNYTCQAYLLGMLGLKSKRHMEDDDLSVVFANLYQLVQAAPQTYLGQGGSYFLLTVPGHAVAFHLGANTASFFEPEEGYYVYANPDTLMPVLYDYLVEEYPPANAFHLHWVRSLS